MSEIPQEVWLEDGYSHSIPAPRGEPSEGCETGLRHGWQQSASGAIPYEGDAHRFQPNVEEGSSLDDSGSVVTVDGGIDGRGT